MKQLSLSLALTLALAACGPTAQQAPAPEAASDQPAEAVPPKAADALAEDALANVLAGSWRSAGDKARDEYRHPKATLEFFGVKPGQTPSNSAHCSGSTSMRVQKTPTGCSKCTT